MADETKKRRFELLRSLVLADFITLGNAACGAGAIFFCLNHMTETDPRWVWGAFVLIPLALFLDMADGVVARWRHRKSPYGADLDSLADTISFGVAPAVLAFTLGMRGAWDALVLMFFVCCGIGRLARYNVTAEALTTEAGKVEYYEGTPIPSSLLLVIILFVAHTQGAIGADLWGGSVRFLGGQFHPLVLLYAVNGGLMISSIRIPKP